MTTPDGAAGSDETQEPPLPDSGAERGTLSAGLSFGAVSFLGTTVVALFTSIFIARLYGVRVVGQFALVYAPVMAAWLLSTVREQPALQREAAVLPPRHPRVTGLFTAVFIFSTGLTIVISVIAGVISWFVFHGPINHPDLFVPAVVSLIGYAVFTNSCVNFDSIFIAFRDGRGLFWLRLHQALVYLVLIVVTKFFSGSVWSLVVATILSWVFPLFHRLITVRKWMRFRISRAETRAGFSVLPQMLSFGLKLTPAGLLWGVCDQMGTWILGSVSTIAAVGAYNRAWFVSQKFLEARQRLSELLFPTLVERRGSGDKEGYDRALIDSLRYATAFLLLFASVGGGAATAIMAVFGPGFGRASTALAFLLLVPVSTTMVSVLSQGLIAGDRPLATSFTALVRLVVTFPAVLILTDQMGITGAAIGMALGAVAQLICQLAVTQREVLLLFPSLWPRRQMLGQVAAYAAGYGAAYGMSAVLPGYVGLPPALVAGTIGYFVILLLVGGLLPNDRGRLAVAHARLSPFLPQRFRPGRRPPAGRGSSGGAGTSGGAVAGAGRGGPGSGRGGPPAGRGGPPAGRGGPAAGRGGAGGAKILTQRRRSPYAVVPVVGLLIALGALVIVLVSGSPGPTPPPAGPVQAVAPALKAVPAVNLPAAQPLFAPSSIWNTPVPYNAPVDPTSSQLVSALTVEVAAELRREVGPWIATRKGSTPLYQVPRDQPTVTVHLENPTLSWRVSLAAAFQSVPLPANAQPAAGGDGHLAVWQPSTNRMWEFFHMRKENGSWYAAWGGAMRNVSKSPGYYSSRSWPGAIPGWGATATSLPVAAGLITLSDLRSGSIDHALAIALPAPRAGVWAWPAQRGDGTGGADTIPEGAELRIDPNLDLSKLSLPPVTMMIAQAVQRYGMIVRDQTGLGLSFYAEDPSVIRDPTIYNGKGGIFGGQLPTKLLAHFPWSHLQVMKMHLCTQTPCAL